MSTSDQAYLKATQDTLAKLNSVGVRLEWDSRYQVAKSEDQGRGSQLSQGSRGGPGSASHDPQTEGEEEEEPALIKKHFEELSRLVRRTSDQSLVGSLLAGPDNESDDSVDVPLLLGRPPDPLDTPSLLACALHRLGIPDDHRLQHLNVRERVEAGSDESVAGERDDDGKAWMLERMYETGRIARPEAAGGSMSSSDDACLQDVLVQFRPRVHFEITFTHHPSIVVCAFLGLLPPQVLSSPPSIGGFISYRVES